MTDPAALVVIQPSYGSPEVRRHWADTLDTEVPFAEPHYADALRAEDLSRLRALHPSGSARFWGTTERHDHRVDRLSTGDVAVLTGAKHVRAIGRIGHLVRAPEFARRLWTPDPARCLWSNVYSLTDYRRVQVPYEVVWALPGFTAGDNFMGLRLLTPEKSAVIIAGLDAATR
ncbi:hypothetical protein [Actinokineospora sp. NBRC 105648]|uniref:hypothetical protein n=1 Tax=Actinokineospora sp. NBRC 105648 TaxID=3032206 RepID=UPI0024A2C3B8|nr:hypothetical protein [Actinokineospora sp. NBRC 105648]GLZ41931.1 hypothetical protein Acsp05_55550 [Actinokineospora sp. NBRC 105648]